MLKKHSIAHNLLILYAFLQQPFFRTSNIIFIMDIKTFFHNNRLNIATHKCPRLLPLC